MQGFRPRQHRRAQYHGAWVDLVALRHLGYGHILPVRLLGPEQLLDLRPLGFSGTAHRSNPQPREPMQVAHHCAGTVERDVHSGGGQVQPLPAFDVVVLDHVPAGVLYVLPVQLHHAVMQGLRVRQHRRGQVHRQAGRGGAAHLLRGRSVWSVVVAAAVLGLYPEDVSDSIGQVSLRIGRLARYAPMRLVVVLAVHPPLDAVSRRGRIAVVGGRLPGQGELLVSGGGGKVAGRSRRAVPKDRLLLRHGPHPVRHLARAVLVAGADPVFVVHALLRALIGIAGIGAAGVFHQGVVVPGAPSGTLLIAGVRGRAAVDAVAGDRGVFRGIPGQLDRAALLRDRTHVVRGRRERR